MSFGVGGELAAIASHIAILRKKQCKSHGERRGAYTELNGDEQFVGSGSSLHEQASEEEYLERIEFSLMANSIQDEDEMMNTMRMRSSRAVPFTPALQCDT